MNIQALCTTQKKLLRGVAFLTLATASMIVTAADITVLGTADTADPPTMCTVAATVSCPSLRAAIRYANETSVGADTITLSAGNYTLSLAGVDETWGGTGTVEDPYVAVITPDASQGDLDITDSLTIIGAEDVDGYLQTTIAWDVQGITDPDVGDRIFHVQALTGTTVSVTLSRLILSNGSVGVIPNTDCSVVDYPYDIERIPGEFCSIWQFRRYGGALAFGPGAGIAFYEEAEHGPDTPGGGGKKPPDVGPGGDEGEGGTISDVSLSRVAIIDNMSGADGGGIYNAAPTDIEESILSGNFSGANGGGLYNDAVMTIDKTLIGTAGSSELLSDLTLLANPNQAENGGGLFDTGFHTTTITASAINGNSAIGGGGIAGRSLIVFNITNTTISDNVATDVGGGVTTNGTINLRSSTVVGNEASTDAPGGGAGLNSFGDGTYNLHNTIVANNLKNTTVDSNCGCSGGSPVCAAGRMVSLGHNLEDADTCQLAFTGDLINTDPLLLPLADNGGYTETHALQHTANGDGVDSPAVEAGDTVNCPNNDQRGGARPADGDLDTIFDCDIGAFELYIPTADLHFENMTAPDEVDKGDTLLIEAVVHNSESAADPAENVEVVTTFAAELTSPSASFSVDGGAATGCTTVATVVTCSVGTLPQNSSVVISLSATASAEGSFSVSSVASTTTADPIPSNNTEGVTVTVVGNSDIQVSAIVDQPTINIGEDITLTATVTNAGPDDATEVRVGTVVPDEVTLVSVTPGAGSCGDMDEDRSISCNIGAVASGDPVTVTYVATVDVPGDIAWSVQSSASQVDADLDNNQATATFLGISADLSLTARVNDNKVEEGDNVTVTVSVENLGPQDASGVTLNVTLPSAWVSGSIVASQGTCSTGPAVSCDLGALALNDDATVTFIGTVRNDVTVSVSATVSATEFDPDGTNNSGAVSIKFEKEENFFERTFGCTAGPGNGFDPTLLFIVLVSLIYLTRRNLKQAKENVAS